MSEADRMERAARRYAAEGDQPNAAAARKEAARLRAAAQRVDLERLRKWALAYQRLMLSGLGEQAHTACVVGFEEEDGEYPYITAADVLALIAEIESLRAKVARVEALAESAGELDNGILVWDLHAALKEREDQ